MYKLAGFTIFVSLLLFSPTFAQDGWWQKVSNGLPGEWSTAWAIDATDGSNVVISIGYQELINDTMYFDHGIFRTTTGGNSWVKIQIPDLINRNFTTYIDLSLKNDSLIWAVTDYGEIIFSPDGGKEWIVQFDDSTRTDFMNYIEMFDEMNGVAMGDPVSPFADNLPVFLRTSDGGSTWVQSSDTTLKGMLSGDTWRRLDFTDPMHGYFYESGINPQKIYKTTDGGDTWSLTNFTGSLVLLKCYDEQFIIGASPVNFQGFYRSVNGGDDWLSYSNNNLGWGTDFEFIPGDASKVFYIDTENFFFSSDSGKTWNKIFFEDKPMSGWDMVFTDDSHGWVLGTDGVYKTDKGFPLSSQEDIDNLPVNFSLSQNYPNPFNPSTTIEYQIPEGDFVSIKIYDLLGREVKTLVNDFKPQGKHKTEFNAGNLSSGIYFYEIHSKDFTARKKMTLLK